ncbi:MAG TPA: hypothetical protein VEI82_12340 [Myxococcota bacterium]|nr:hypothetical protein [Myxococcota bacterium]
MATQAILCASLLALLLGQSPPLQTAPSDDEVRELQARLDTLQQEIDQLAAASSAEQRQSLMQQSWRSMQEYMGWMHSRWGAGAPWMMGGGMMQGQGPGVSSCPMLGGSSAPWPPPEGVSPEQYAKEMREHMKRMREQMSQIAQAKDLKERQRLLQEHWQSMYGDMETMRGLGWMWGNEKMGPGMMGPAMMGGGPGMMGPGMMTRAEALPDAGSPGAKLVSQYCTRCHAAPPPKLHTSQEWERVLDRMDLHMTDAGAGVRLPDAKQLQTMLGYMQRHAR